MDDIFEYVRLTTGKINREVNDLESLMFVMNMLKEVRDKESQMDMEIKPIIELYTLLEDFLPEGYAEHNFRAHHTVGYFFPQRQGRKGLLNSRSRQYGKQMSRISKYF